MTWQLVFSRVNDPREQGRSSNTFYGHHASPHLAYFIGHAMPALIQCGKGTDTWRHESFEDMIRAYCYNTRDPVDEGARVPITTLLQINDVL